MKNMLFIILIILFIIIVVISANLIDKQTLYSEIKKENLEYEKYANRIVLGTEIATLINKAVNENEKNEILKDEQQYYLENKVNSIKIYLKMTTLDKTYAMEEIYNNEISEFVKNFNLINFKCIQIDYHNETGKISKLIFEEIEEV